MTSAQISEPAAGDRTLDGLRRFNLIVGLLHLAQAAAMLALSNDLAFPSPPHSSRAIR